MITKNQVIYEVMHHVRVALEKKLTDREYVEFVKGSISFRLDLVLPPQKYFVTVDLPTREEPALPALQIGFVRRYSRRQALLPPEVTHAHETASN